MRAWVAALGLVGMSLGLSVGISGTAWAADPPALVRARTHYNAGNYAAAIEAAAEARRNAAAAPAAALVLARAHLEQFRVTRGADDLTAAREALLSIAPARLGPRDQVDLLVALGQALFLDDAFGAAAEVFDSALSRSGLLPARDRTRLLDWWAAALDREAQSRPADRREVVYARIVDRMEDVLRAAPESAPGNYWLASALRGAGDLERAWDAAVAGWVRVTGDPAVAGEVRPDLDRLVSQALVPERARQRPAREQMDALTALRAVWDQIKAQWP